MWAAGVSRSDAERFHRRADACALEQTLDSIELSGARGQPATARLRLLLADSARVVRSPEAADPLTRFLPGFPYTPECVERLRDDRRGVTRLTPLLLAKDPTITYARDLHSRDSLMLADRAAGSIYLLRPASAEDAMLRFDPLDRDSLFAAWRAAPRADTP
jgi:hypothetical protein